MHISQKDLDAAVKKRLIKRSEADQLWNFWQNNKKDVPAFRMTHILYYLGGFIAIAAITIYVTTAWERLQGFPLLFLALCLLLFGMGLTHYFLEKKLRIPAGIMATFSLALVPLIVYNLQYLLGVQPTRPFVYTDFHTYIDWYWTNMELATLLVGIIMFYFYRFPFLFFPIAVVLWYMSMDLWPLFFNSGDYTFNEHARFTMFFGLVILAAAIYMDFRYDDKDEDYAFWLYLAGVMTFWGGLSCQSSTSELSKFFYLIINVVMLFIGAILDRRVFAIFAALGILSYLGHLTFKVFANSLSFPIILILIGILIILAGVFFTRIEASFRNLMRPYVPKKILERMKY